MFRTASLSVVPAHRADAPRDRHDADRDQPQHQERADDRADVEQRKPLVVGKANGEGGERQQAPRLALGDSEAAA